MTLRKVVLVDLESEVHNLGHLMCTPRFGLTVIGSVLDGAGYDVTVLADCYGKVTAAEIVQCAPDVVMFNGLKTTLHRVRGFAREVKRRLPHVPIVLGGEEATLNPPSVLDFADCVVLQEGDQIVLELLTALNRNESLFQVKGVLYREGGTWKRTEPARRVQPITYRLNPDIYRGLRQMSRTFLGRRTCLTRSGRLLYFPLQTSRGCDRACSFCTWKSLFGGRGYVERAPEDVLHDIDRVVVASGVRDFMVVDNLFGKTREHALDLATRIIRRFPDQKTRPEFTVLMRADQFGDDGYTAAELAVLRIAGFRDVTLGLESVNDRTLRQINKGVSSDEYAQAIHKLVGQGIRVCGTFSVGSGFDELDDVRRIVPFARRVGLRRLHLYAYSVIPGMPAEKQDGHLRIPGIDPRFVNGHGVVIFPRRMLPSELQEEILKAMDRFYSWLTVEGFFYKTTIRRIRRSLRLHLRQLKSIERRLIEREVYVCDRSTGRYLLDEDKLRQASTSWLRALALTTSATGRGGRCLAGSWDRRRLAGIRGSTFSARAACSRGTERCPQP
ncbi:B12-binding domain-containing radical SAM protein [Planctomycetota bacterium]